MQYKILLVVVIIGIIILTYNKYTNKETYTNDPNPVNTTNSTGQSTLTPPTLYDSNLMNDSLFKDVVYYENDIRGDVYGRIGLDKCLENCNGTCLEFGVTGNAYCFPKQPNIPAETGNLLTQEF